MTDWPNVEDALREALQAMVDHEVACMTLYNLGDPEKQPNIIRARAALAAEPASGVEHDNERIDPLGGNSPPPMGAVVSNADVLATMDALYKFNVATEEEANRNLIPPPPPTQDQAMTEPSQSSREIAEEIRQSAQEFGFRQWAKESDFAIHLAECLDKATRAENEACALLVEQMSQYADPMGGSAICRAIRARIAP